MKTKSLLLIAFIAVLFTSCAPTSFFQVYKAVPSENVNVADNVLTCEDENCIISYDFWGDGGNIGFRFNNKTDEPIYVNLEECFFILNGSSYNYYKDRVYTYSKGVGVGSTGSATASTSVTGINYYGLVQTNQVSATSTSELMASKGYAVSYTEEKIIRIPAKTSKVISEYLINNTLFRDCDLYKYPSQKQINTITFSRENSPLVFSNRISYTVGQADELTRIENEFYVTEMTNYPEIEMYDSDYNEYCGQKSISKSKYFKDVSADKFYIKYKKADTWKH